MSQIPLSKGKFYGADIKQNIFYMIGKKDFMEDLSILYLN